MKRRYRVRCEPGDTGRFTSKTGVLQFVRYQMAKGATHINITELKPTLSRKVDNE